MAREGIGMARIMGGIVHGLGMAEPDKADDEQAADNSQKWLQGTGCFCGWR